MRLRSIATLLLCALLPPAAAAGPETRQPGSGVLSAVAPDGTPLGACPLQHTSALAEISGFVARVVVTQVFSNPHPDPVEAVYTFPLSARAAVDAMWMRTGGRVIRGEIERREEARRRYQQARERGQLAGLLDEERPNVFTQSLANLMPGATVEIEIHYVESLAYEAGTFEFSFPTVVGPRFVPGAPTGHSGTGWAPDTTRVPDASRITPPVTPEGTRAGHDIDISVEIDAGVPIREIESKLHEIDVEWRSSSQAVVGLRRRRAIPNRDFVLRYAVAGDRIQNTVLTHREGSGEGFATFVLLPPRRVTPTTAAPKEMIFVIDRSGSQSGRPLAKAKETLLWILDHMNPNDTFQIVDFGSDARKLFDHPLPASAAMKRRARTYIEGLRANGGTFMAEAIREVAGIPADGNRLRIVTFMTDGYVGNDFEVIDVVRRLRGTSRWFPFGTGNSVNRFLLDNMAREGGGEVEYVLLNASGEEVAKRFYERIASPVLTDVHLEFRGLEVENLHPDELADVWAEKPLVVHARYREPGRGRVIVHGYHQGQPYREELDVRLPEREERNAALASLWARARVDALMRRDLPGLQSGRFPEALEEEIVEIALAHRILTPFTSFVAVEERVVNQGGRPRTVTVPVEMPQGVEYEGIFGEADAAGPLPRAAAPFASASMARHSSRALDLAEALSAGDAKRSAASLPQKERPAVSKRAQRRLAPELRALLLRGDRSWPGLDIVDGELKVKVVLRDSSEAAIRALEALGLRMLQRTDDYAIARIPLAALARLAESEHVERIEPA